MKPKLFAKGNNKTKQKLIRLRNEAQHDKAPRVALRIHGVILSIEKYPPSKIASLLKIDRTTVPIWINNWNQYGEEGLLEGHRSGRLPKLSDKELKHLYDILESGPIAYGYSTGVWTSPIIAQVIRDEFNVEYHEGHVRKILTKIGFSVQRPTTKIVAGNDDLRRKWRRYRYPNLKKTRKSKGRQ
jgi:transposase